MKRRNNSRSRSVAALAAVLLVGSVLCGGLLYLHLRSSIPSVPAETAISSRPVANALASGDLTSAGQGRDVSAGDGLAVDRDARGALRQASSAGSVSPVGKAPAPTREPLPAASGDGAPGDRAPGNVVAASPASEPSGRSVADILADADMRDPAVRARVAARLQDRSAGRREAAHARALTLGIPVRIESADGRVLELQDFDGDKPLYYGTYNANAALSGNVTALHGAPFSLGGGRLPLGVWDGGSVRSTHAELTGRVLLKNSSSAIDDHATHVAGTMAAAGAQPAAKGMAPAATLHSYDWNHDLAEMTLAGAATATDTNRLAISNHSYGYIAGYLQTDFNRWRWFGTGSTVSDTEPEFGRYSSYTRDWDAVAFSLPYYTIFKAAGNDRTDNPATGHRVDSYTGGFLFHYDPARHPGGDGVYRGGYENISYAALAKNIITVGAVNDAVSGGVRHVPGASMSVFSSWGPTDDGRIKPDLVANGVSLYSSTAAGNTHYASYSGTSMASPSAAGAAALLIELYAREFAGRLMPSSLLKALLIHTADDLGTPGPNYRFGWGLLNAAAAADLIMLHKQSGGSPKLIESQVTTGQTTYTHTFAWDGVSPIRATLCWTDPAGPVQSAGDSRASTLVHNLDLTIAAPGGQVYLPYTMPFVGAWNTASMAGAAVPGKNNTDNVEQVYIAAPPAPGTYTATVSLDGSLTRSLQNFALVLTGSVSDSAETRVISLAGNMDFGSVAVGSSVARTLTIVNLGNAPLTVTGIQVPGGFSGTWSGSIAPGASQGVTITFTPPSADYFSGLLQVGSDATAGGGSLAVSGTGQGSVTSLANGVAVTGLSGIQGSERFFVINVPAHQEGLSFVMTGSGDADLYVRFGNLPSVSQWDYRPYLESSNERVDVNAPEAGDWYVMIRGYSSYSGVSLTATYAPPAGDTRILRLAGDLAFGNIPVGGRVERPVVLYNDGNSPLTVTGIDVPAGYECAWTGVVEPGGSQSLDITFAPVAEQVYAGPLTVVSDKTAGEDTLPVSGNGVESHIPLQNGIQAGPFSSQAGGAILFFVDVPAGQDRLRVTAYDDVSAIDVYVRQGQDPTLQDYDARASESGVPGVVEILTPSAGRWYIMLYAVAQYRDVRLVAEHETTASTERIIRLEGTLAFGDVRLNESVTQTYAIHNDGNAPLNVTGVLYPDGYTGGGVFSIPAGASQTVQVTFRPTAAINYNGLLTVQSNAESGVNTLPLSGYGIAVDEPVILQNGVPLAKQDGATDSMRHYAIDVPSGSSVLSVAISGGTGDADLYLRRGSPPTLADWDYRPYQDGNNEVAVVASPAAGRWYIMLHGYHDYAEVTLLAEYWSEADVIALGDAVDAPALAWTTGGNAPWFGQTAVSRDGVDAARSGPITHNQHSWLQTVVSGPGTISFWWKVSSEANYDFLRFRIAGMDQHWISGEQDWARLSVAVPAGTHTLAWLYSKDESVSLNSDAGWVDQVVWVKDRPQRFDAAQPIAGYAVNRWSFMTAWNLSTGALEMSPRWRNGVQTWEHSAAGHQQWIARFSYDDTTGRTTALAWYYRQSHVQ